MSPRPKIALKKEAIMQAAGELANEYGSENLSVALLAKKLNIKPPSLYNHFNGLADLKRALAIYSLERLHENLVGEANGIPLGEARVLALSKGYLAFARKEPGLYEAALAAPDPADHDVFSAGKKVVDLVVEAVEPLGLKEDEALHAVRGLRSLMHGFASLEGKGGFGLSLDLEESYERAIQAFIAGLKK